MTEEELNCEYFEWMNQLVYNARYSEDLSYHKLFIQLYDTDFYYTIDMDANRVEDGIDLRYRFGYELGYDQRIISSYLDNKPCSVLEMMVALALRCEETIMSDPEIGDRTGQWFWNMIVNLGLGSMDDSKFDSNYVDFVLTHFMERDYEPNGEGGLFQIDCGKDLRQYEIWYQMNWYINKFV